MQSIIIILVLQPSDLPPQGVKRSDGCCEKHDKAFEEVVKDFTQYLDAGLELYGAFTAQKVRLSRYNQQYYSNLIDMREVWSQLRYEESPVESVEIMERFVASSVRAGLVPAYKEASLKLDWLRRMNGVAR